MGNPMDDLNPLKAEPSRCTAKSKRTGERCKRPPATGWGVCRMHGAGGGRPIVHGRYSKVLKRLRGHYEAARDDENLLDLRPTIAVLDIRIEDILRRVDDGDDAAWG